MRYLIFAFLLFITGVFTSCDKDNDSDPVEDPDPIVTNPVGYQQYGNPFNQVPPNSDIVLYEVNLRAFSNSGDLQAVIDRLDHIESLGVNVIWLMPINTQGQLNSVGSPYAVRDYKSVSDEYGDLEDLRRLTTLAHERGIAVIMDWVANHTSWDHEWINTHRDWYTQDVSGNIIHPAGTNWQDVADLNYTNQEMREAMIDAMKYWLLEANVDGFRCDYADGVPTGFWTQAWQEIESIPNRDFILFAEGNRNDHFNAGFDLTFGWDFYTGVKNIYDSQPASSIFQVSSNEYAQVPQGKEVVRFTTNHDASAWEATPISIFGSQEAALSASVVTIFMDGVPLIYGSQEVGRSSTLPFFTSDPIDWNQNPNLLESYQNILSFYANTTVAKRGVTTTFNDPDIVAFKKEYAGDEMVILTNTQASVKTFPIPTALNNSTWTDVISGNSITLTGQISLQPYQFYILH